MGSFTMFVALTWMVGTVLLYSAEAAPVTEFFGPPQTIEGDSTEQYEKPKVKEMERFHRTYNNGTIEFKMALSNGHVQYQRISPKIVGGEIVRVYEGYISEKYKDGRYGTRYYAADENGYRSSSVMVEEEPPQLPTSGPYSTNLPQDIQKELSPMLEYETQTKRKNIEHNLVEIENDLNEELLSNLNLGSKNDNKNSISSTESSETLNPSEEPASVVQNFNEDQTELPISLDLPSTTELLELLSTTRFENYNEASKPTTLPPVLEEGSGIGDAAVSSTEQPLNEETTTADKVEESSGVQTSGILSGNDDKNENINDDSISDSKKEQSTEEIPEGTTGSLLNDIITSTEQIISTNNENQEQSTSVVPQLNEIKTDGDTSNVSRYPLQESTILSSVDSTSSSEVSEGTSSENNSEIPSSNIASEVSNNPEITTEETVTSKNEYLDFNTEKPLEKVSEAANDNDGLTSTEAATTLSNEVQESSTSAVPEGNEIKADIETSSVSGNSHDDLSSQSVSQTPEQPLSNENGDISNEITTSARIETTSEFSPEIEHSSTVTSYGVEVNIETTTGLPLESSTSTDQGNENNARSIDILNVLPLSENNSTSENEGSKINSKTSNSEETTGKIDISTEQPTEEERISSTASSGNISFDITTEAEVIATTTENGLEASSSEKTDDNSQTTTSSVGTTSSEENKENSTEDTTSTELPKKSNEEDHNTIDYHTKVELFSVSEEKEGRSTKDETSTEISNESNEENTSTEVSSKTEEKEQNSSKDENTTALPEESSEKSAEDEASTELPEESSEEGHSKASVNEQTTESEEVLSTTEETSRGVEVELSPPVIHF